MKNTIYYIKNYIYQLLPQLYFLMNYKRLKTIEKSLNQQEIKNRLDYYFKFNKAFSIPDTIPTIKEFKKTKGSGYYFDLKEFFYYFKSSTKFVYYFGDETRVSKVPTLIKARPIEGNNQTSILFKLNKLRHFKWVTDTKAFEDKKSKIVWRGGAYRDKRKTFIMQYWNHPLCEVGQTNRPAENQPWQKSKMSIKQQLNYKYILSLEGNDVATNLKWILSSNSLCIMPKPEFETWFMEGKLMPGVHYVKLDDDYKNLETVIKFYEKHPEKAKKIIKKANEFVLQFQDKNFEDLLCLKVLEKYSLLSNQKKTAIFNQ